MPSWSQGSAVCISQFSPRLTPVGMSDSVNEPFGFFVFNFACTRCPIPSLLTIMVRPTTNHKQPHTPSPPIRRNVSLGGEGTSSPPPPDYHLGQPPSPNGSSHHSVSPPIGSAAYRTFTMTGRGRGSGRGIEKPASKPSTLSAFSKSRTLPLPSGASTHSSSHWGQPLWGSAGVPSELDSISGIPGILYRTGLGASPLVRPAPNDTRNESNAIPGLLCSCRPTPNWVYPPIVSSTVRCP